MHSAQPLSASLFCALLLVFEYVIGDNIGVEEWDFGICFFLLATTCENRN